MTLPATASEHVCRASANPRREGWCDCGRQLPSSPEQPVPRSLDLEREYVTHATRGVTNPTSILQHAETRSCQLSGEYVDNWMLIKRGRNRVQEMKEEFADAINHGVFDLQLMLDAGEWDDDRAYRILDSIRYTVLAYNALLED